MLLPPDRMRALLHHGQGGRTARITPQALFTIPPNPYDCENQGAADWEEVLIDIRAESWECIPWTVTLVGPMQPGSAPTKVNGGRLDLGGPDTFARVQWGNGAFNAEAKIDWVRGTTFTVYASSLQVSGVFPYPSYDLENLGQIGAFAVPGVRQGGRYPAQRSVRFGETGARLAESLPFEGDLTIDIPPFARRMRHTIIGSSSDPLDAAGQQQVGRTFAWLDSTAGSPVAIHEYSAAPAGGAYTLGNMLPSWPGDAVDVPRNATRLRLYNTDDSGSDRTILQCVAIFELDL